MLTDYQLAQLTNQSECFLHTHPRGPLDGTSSMELDSATRTRTVADGTTLDYSYTKVAVDPAGGDYGITLPPALNGKELYITLSGTGTLTVTPYGTDTIMDEPDMVLTEQWTTMHLKADEAGNWYAI